MKYILAIVGFMAIMAGCTTHYYQEKSDKLVLYLNKPHAQRVILACSLDGFEPHEARCLNGRWEVTLPSENQFRYYYVVDGEIFLPPCQIREPDDFGSENCVFDPQLSCFLEPLSSKINFQ